MDKYDTKAIRKIIEGEEEPDMVDLVCDIIPGLLDEIEELQKKVEELEEIRYKYLVLKARIIELIHEPNHDIA
jgi:hypothetical protein